MNLILVGDVMLGRMVNEVLQRQPPAYPWGDTLPLFRAADCRVCNLECVLADVGRPWAVTPKVFHFRSAARNVSVLEAAGIDAVSLANNHALDYEYDALFEMLRLLDEHGIRHAGAGRDYASAWRAAFWEVRGTRVGLVAFSDNQQDWEATEQTPGICYVPVRPEDECAARLFEVVRRAKAQADLLIVAAHWGPNWGYRPRSKHLPFGRALIDAGADVVFGHSCHVFQGIEFYRGRPILYSTGNFVDDYAVDEVERNDQSFVFCLETERGSCAQEPRRLRLYPTVIREYQALRAQGQDAASITAKMRELCTEFGTPTFWRAEEECLEVVPP